MERIYTIDDFTEEDAKYLQSRVEIWADQFNRHAEYIGLKDRAHVGRDIHNMPQVEWDYGYIYTLDPFGEKWEIKFGDNKYKVPKLKVVDKLYSLMDSMVGYKYSSKSKQKTKGESMKYTCSMQKKKESLGKKSEEAIPFKLTEFPKELKQMRDACSKKLISCDDELSSATDVASGKDGVSSAHYVLKGKYGTYAEVKVILDYEKEEGFTVTIKGLDETTGYSWVALGEGKSTSFKEALSTALSEFDKNISTLVTKIRKAMGKSEAKKSEGASDTIKVTAENVMLTVNDVYVDDHGGSFSVETPEEGKSYNLLDMQEMIRGMCEDCTGYANYSRDGSELLIEIMAGEMDDSGEWTGDYYTAYSFRCIARIMSYSLEGIIDFLDESN